MNRLSLMTSLVLVTTLVACEEEELENVKIRCIEDVDSDGDGVVGCRG